MGSRAVAVVCRDADVADERFGIDDGTSGASTRAPADRSSPTARVHDDLVARVRARRDAAARRARLRLGRARRRAAAVVGQGARPDPRPVRRRRAPLPARAPGRRRGARRGRRAGHRRRCPRDPHDGRARPRRAFRDAYAAYCEPDTGARRRTAGAVPGARPPRAGRSRSPSRTRGTSSVARPPRRPADHTDPPRAVDLSSQADRAAATAVVARAHRRRRRGHGRQAGPTPCSGSRVQPGLKVRGREYLRIIYGPDYTGALDVLRGRHLGKKQALAAPRARPRRRRPRRLRPPAPRCGRCTSSSSPSLPWSQSRSTRACDPPGPGLDDGWGTWTTSGHRPSAPFTGRPVNGRNADT